MFARQRKTPVIAGRGRYPVRAAGKRPNAPAALLATPKQHFWSHKHEIIKH